MSGGSYDYLFGRLEDAANQIKGSPLRRAFARHLLLISKALYEIEWADSGDTSPGNNDEIAAIQACLPKGADIQACIEEAKKVLIELQAAIEANE